MEFALANRERTKTKNRSIPLHEHSFDIFINRIVCHLQLALVAVLVDGGMALELVLESVCDLLANELIYKQYDEAMG